MPIINDPRYTSDAIVGQVRQQLMPAHEAEEPSPGALAVLSAASRQNTLAGAAYARVSMPDPDMPDADPNFDALDNIAGYEQHAKSFVNAATPSEVQGIKTRIDAQSADRKVLDRAGLGGPVAEIGMNLLDPSFLVSLAVPELAVFKAARVGRVGMAAVEGAATAGVYETGMHQLQPDRTLTESAFNVGGGALFSGVLGSLGRRMPAHEVAATLDGVRSEVGAAAVARPTTLAEESFAAGGGAVSKVMGAVPVLKTDLQVVMESDSIAARLALQDLAEVAPHLEKNVAGVATPTSVETLLARNEGRLAQFSDQLDNLWTKYRTRLRESDASDFPLPRDERLTKEEFYAAVSGSARRGDDALVPEVAEGAKALRAGIFDPLKAQAQKLGLLPKDVEVVGAESYFRRMYDRNAIRANRREWDSIITKHFFGQGLEYGEARSVGEQITRKILGADVGQANFNLRSHVPDAGPLHDRVLDIADELIEPFLVNDPMKVASAYVRELGPQIEITRRFGDKDMKDVFDKIRSEYDVLREKTRGGVVDAAHSKPLTALQDQEQATLEALVRVRDRIYGRAGRLSPDASTGMRRAVTAARNWRNLTAAAKLGGTAMTGGITDLSRIVGQYGFMPTVAKMVKLTTSPAFRALSKQQAKRMGAACEVALSRRVHIASDGAITEGWSQKLAEGVYKYTGLNHITDYQRVLSATLMEDTVLKAAADVAAGKTLPGWTRTRLASLGLDGDALQRIHAQVGKHGGEVDGVRVSGSADWDDFELGQVYDAAILKESRIAVMQPGHADHVWWMDSETGKVLGQIKSFTLAAPMKLLAAPAQMIGAGEHLQAARLIGSLLIGGYLAHVFRQFAAGVMPTTDLQGALGEAFTESGLAGILPDLISPVARSPLGGKLTVNLTGGLIGESAKFSDRNVASAYLGPAAGFAQDATELLFNRSANGVSAADLRMLRRLAPYQNVWYLRRAINALEGETAEALDLKGADTATFGQRFFENRDLLPASQRGSTGTGQVVQ